jgi:glycosyltransferase involved in cell wall biosynthesis
MRIAYLHYLIPDDGALLHVQQFAAGCRALGHRVDVHAMNLAPPEPVPGESVSWTRRARGALKQRLSRALHEPKELLWNWRYRRKERDLLLQDRPDVLLVRDHLITSSCVRVARDLDLPLVLELNAPAAESRLYFDEYWHLPFISERLEAYKLRAANLVTVVSTALRDHLVEQYRVPESKFLVNPNGVDLDRFTPDVDPEPGLKSGDGEVVVGFVGSFAPWHGSALLARLIVEVLRARPNVRFLLVGDGPDRALVESAARPFGRRVTFTGRIAHARIPSIVTALDVAVTAEAAFYQSPLKVPEWMACGRAVVAPGYGPLRELIEDGVHGLLFTPRDLGSLVSAVLRAIDDPDLRRRLGKAAAARARGSLSWTMNAGRVVGAIEPILARRETAESRLPGRLGAG